MSKLQVTRVRDVKLPTRGTKLSAGLDFYIPNDYDGQLILEVGESVTIPSGVHVKPEENYALIFFNKSGVAVNKNLQVGACVVDEDYQGEVHLHVTNIGYMSQCICPGDKLVQGLLIKVDYAEIEEIGCLQDLYPTITERGEGKMGSTGTR